jgi:quercetin dioxygenase-like cupin family protein
VFDLAMIAEELRSEDAYVREGQTARTLARTSDLRIVFVAVAAGNTVSEHRIGVTASVQTITGHVGLKLQDGFVDLPAGQLLVLGPGVPHDVTAKIASTFLLTLGWPRADPSG